MKSHGLRWEHAAMRSAEVGALDAGAVLALLMGAVRAESLCGGALLKFLLDGSILKWLKRLKDFDEGDGIGVPTEIRLRVSSFFYGVKTCRLLFEEGGARLTITFSLSDAVWERRYSAADVERLMLRQKIGSGCLISHQYDVQGGMDEILLAADRCFQSEEWDDMLPQEHDAGLRFYHLTAEYYDGSQISHAGVYSWKDIPSEPWSKLIDAVLDFIGSYDYGELLNKKAFLNAGKAGEVKYCRVSFEDCMRTFYYRTDDEGIREGDPVIVPFGASNAERKGTVEEIGYYRVDEVPFPLEKTKKILRKPEEGE